MSFHFQSADMLTRTLQVLAVTATLIPLFPNAGSAQEPGDSIELIRQEYRVPPPPTLDVLSRGTSIGPGITISSPTGFGASHGDAFVGAAYQLRTRTFTRQDGGVAVGFGVGNPSDFLGLEVAATSFGTVRSCCRGGIHFKAHRLIPGRASVAVGWENAILWNPQDNQPATDAGRSLYVAASKLFLVRSDGSHRFSTLTVTAGLGNGRFRRERDVVADRSTVNVFGSASLRAAERLSLIVDWTGQDLFAGVSLLPLRNRPIFITPAVADLTSRPRFILGVGLGFNYSAISF
jgi:hypothetical protein